MREGGERRGGVVVVLDRLEGHGAVAHQQLMADLGARHEPQHRHRLIGGGVHILRPHVGVARSSSRKGGLVISLNLDRLLPKIPKIVLVSNIVAPTLRVVANICMVRVHMQGVKSNEPMF